MLTSRLNEIHIYLTGAPSMILPFQKFIKILNGLSVTLQKVEYKRPHGSIIKFFGAL